MKSGLRLHSFFHLLVLFELFHGIACLHLLPLFRGWLNHGWFARTRGCDHSLLDNNVKENDRGLCLDLTTYK